MALDSKTEVASSDPFSDGPVEPDARLLAAASERDRTGRRAAAKRLGSSPVRRLSPAELGEYERVVPGTAERLIQIEAAQARSYDAYRHERLHLKRAVADTILR